MNRIITEREVIGMFYEALQQDLGMWIDAISTNPMESDQDSETYPWLGQVPQLSQFAGVKKFSQLRTEQWAVANIMYQAGIRFPKNHILYDKTGQVTVRVREAAERAASHWFSLVAPLIVAGESTDCYDGQFFFDDDHSEGDSGTQSNDIGASAATPTAPTAVEFIDAILAAVEQMIGFKDDQGEYCNEGMTDFLVTVGTPLMTGAMKALSQSNVSSGDTNILIEQDSFRFRIAVSPRFSAWTTKFALFATQGQQKPIIRQQRIPNNAGGGYDAMGMSLETLWLDSEYCKLNNECLLTIDTERAAAYGDWKKAVLTTFS